MGIDIDDTNARFRAFKSLYWAPRWTSVNLAVFDAVRPMSLPYYDNRMCEFICTVPESMLKNRSLQIAYIKKRAPDLAKITWQDQRPFNLNNYHRNKVPYNLPYRAIHKMGRILNGLMGRPYVQRNWELQFLGKENLNQLEKRIFRPSFNTFIPKNLISKYYHSFIDGNTVQNAHPLSMLLTLSEFYTNTKQ